MSTLYKVYAGILAFRLREEVEEKGLLTENQAGFRKERRRIKSLY